MWPFPLSFNFLLLPSSFTLLQPNWPVCFPLQTLGVLLPQYFALVFLSAWNSLLSEFYLANISIASSLYSECTSSIRFSWLPFLNCNLTSPYLSTPHSFYFAIFFPLPPKILYTLLIIIFIMYCLSRCIRKEVAWEQGSLFYSLMYQKHWPGA